MKSNIWTYKTKEKNSRRRRSPNLYFATHHAANENQTSTQQAQCFRLRRGQGAMLVRRDISCTQRHLPDIFEAACVIEDDSFQVAVADLHAIAVPGIPRR